MNNDRFVESAMDSNKDKDKEFQEFLEEENLNGLPEHIKQVLKLGFAVLNYVEEAGL